MIWFLLGLGLVLVVLGVWGGPAQRARLDKTARIPPESTVQEAWDILTSPLQYDEEVIKIPEHRPWYLPGGDRRFYRGLAVGFGAGLLVAAALLPFFGGRQAPPEPGPEQNPAVVGGTEQKGPDAQEPGTQKPPEGEEPSDVPGVPESPELPEDEPTDKPVNVTVTIEMGSTSQDIAALLKENGLIGDEQEFLSVVTELGVETQLKAGTFVIPTDATPIEIVNMLTQG